MLEKNSTELTLPSASLAVAVKAKLPGEVVVAPLAGVVSVTDGGALGLGSTQSGCGLQIAKTQGVQLASNRPASASALIRPARCA